MEAKPETCPLCEKEKYMHKAKDLYGTMICSKCYYGFANRRQFAFVLDVIGWRILVLPLSYALGYGMGHAMVQAGSSQEELEAASTMIGYGIGYILLPIFFCKDCFSGHSIGKIMCGVRVVNETTGNPANIWASFKRNLPLIIPFMPLIVGGQLCKGHRTGDGWARSKVIWKKYADHPIFAPAQNDKLVEQSN